VSVFVHAVIVLIHYLTQVQIGSMNDFHGLKLEKRVKNKEL
jgi:hypothetical protein